MAVSAPKVLKLTASRLVTDQLWLMYRFEYIDGTPVDIRTWGLTMKATSTQQEGFVTSIPTTIVGDDHDYLQVLVTKPETVLTIGPSGNTAKMDFKIRMARAEQVGEISLTYTYLTIDPEPVWDSGNYDTGSVYPEIFVIQIDPDTDEITDVLGIPGAPMIATSGFVPTFVQAGETFLIPLNRQVLSATRVKVYGRFVNYGNFIFIK